MKSFYRILPCIVLASLVGCIPLPHQYLTAPQISGTVTNAGKPVAGARVQLADVMDASGAVASAATKLEVVTDTHGHFAVGPIRRSARTRPVPLFNVAQHTAPWGLRLSAGTQSWQPGWLSDASLYGEVPTAPIVAACDVSAASKSSVIKGDEALVGNGPCDLTAVEARK